MDAFLQLLLAHGYLVVVLWVLADQAGLPLPAIPVLVGAGVLAGLGQLELGWVIVLAAVTALVADCAWYYVGRHYGKRVLEQLCRWSLEPDFCVRQTGAVFQRYGPVSLLFSSFIPAFQTIAPPLAGAAALPLASFVALRAAGCLLWAVVFVLPGYFLAPRAEKLLTDVSAAGQWMAGALAAALAGFILYKWLRRQLFLRAVRTGTVGPGELHAELDATPDVHIVDLRHLEDVKTFPYVIPRAEVIPLEHIDDHLEALSLKRDVVLYCT